MLAQRHFAYFRFLCAITIDVNIHREWCTHASTDCLVKSIAQSLYKIFGKKLSWSVQKITPPKRF